MSDRTLIHLVSGQAMQNLLPVLALRPDRVVQVRSAGANFRDAPQRIINAVTEIRRNPGFAEYNPEFKEVELSESHG